MAEPTFTFDYKTRQFRDEATGRFVSRADLRRRVDVYVDNVRARVKQAGERLRDGRLTLPQWQLEMESIIKRGHTASGAIGSGGWKQATSADWGRIGARVKSEYGYLQNFAIDIENGLPLDGRFLNRAQQYGQAVCQSYESQIRKLDLASGPMEERRLLHAEHSCNECISYAARGWQPGGELPDIGAACSCKSSCRCSFERRALRR